MGILSYKYSIVSLGGETKKGFYFANYDIYKETLIFGFSLFGEIVNKYSFLDYKEAEEFLTLIDKQ